MHWISLCTFRGLNLWIKVFLESQGLIIKRKKKEKKIKSIYLNSIIGVSQLKINFKCSFKYSKLAHGNLYISNNKSFIAIPYYWEYVDHGTGVLWKSVSNTAGGNSNPMEYIQLALKGLLVTGFIEHRTLYS